MKTVACAIILMLSLSACDKPMTNDEIIAETKKCKAAGLDARELYRELNPGVIVLIQCKRRGAQ